MNFSPATAWVVFKHAITTDPPSDMGAIGLDVHRVTLRFRNEQAGFEAHFLQRYFDENLNYLRLIHFVAIIFYGFTGVVDAAIFPNDKMAFWVIRYGVVIPIFLAGFLLSFTGLYRKHWQGFHVVYILASGGGFIAMLVIGPHPSVYSYYVGVIICLFFGYTFCRERFVFASTAGLLLVALYLTVSLYMVETPGKTLLHNTLYIFTANFLGMMICYFMEFSARRNFLLVHLFRQERKKVQRINAALEKRVEERTAEILETSKQLEEEMAAHFDADNKKRELESQLQRAQKMESLGTLAGGVAHDLNNILSGIVSYPDLLLTEIPEENPLRSALLTIKTSGEKAAAIVQDLLTLARRGVAVSEVLDLNAIISAYLESAEFGKLETDHPLAEFDICLSDHLSHVMGSPVHLSKTVMNLVNNAVEAMPDGGTIGITTGNRDIRHPHNGFMTIAPGRYATVKIVDTGTGIASEDMERIFEPFYTKKVMGRSGTGLGMAVVWGTVQDHHGFIDIQSAEGKGTTLTLFFPSTDQPVDIEGKDAPLAGYRGNGELIVVVDDMAEQREIAAKMLARLGYTVKTLPSGEEAVRYMQGHSADLLILDMIMDSGIDGLETYRRILRTHPGQNAIITSGFSETAQVEELQQLGGGQYIRKPYHLQDIGLAVKKALAS